MTQSLRYEDNVNLVHKVSRRVFDRMNAMNIGLEYEDVFQELSIVYLNAVSKFDVEKGFAFSTYFTRSAFNQAGKIIEREKHYAYDIKAFSLNEVNSDGDDMEDHLGEIADTEASQEIQVELSQAIDQYIKRLSPTAKKILELAISPTPMLLSEIKASELKSKLALANGTVSRRKPTLSKVEAATKLMAKLMNLSAHLERRLMREVEPLVDYVG